MWHVFMESCEMRHCWKCFECILRALLNSDCSLHQKKQNQPTKKKKPKPKTSPHPRFYWGYGKLFAPCRLLSWVPVEILSQIKTLNLCKNWVSGFEIAELIWLPKGEVLLFFFILFHLKERAGLWVSTSVDLLDRTCWIC